jgi:hypothetical protein
MMSDIMKSILLPVFVAVIVGFGSSYMGFLIAVARLDERMLFVQRDVNENRGLRHAVAENTNWIKTAEYRLTDLEKKSHE